MTPFCLQSPRARCLGVVALVIAPVWAVADASESEPLTAQAEESRLVIEWIDLIGNSKTERATILGRLSIRVGDLVDDAAVEESRRRLLGTGFFRTVDLSLRRGSRPGQAIVVIQVEERNTIRMDGLYVGRTSIVPFFFGGEVSERNLFGRGMRFGLGGAAGGGRHALDLHAFIPELSQTPLGLWASFTLAHGIETQASLEQPEFGYDRTGGSLGVLLALGPDQHVSLKYRLESVLADRRERLDPVVLRSSPSIQFDESILSSVILEYERDTRDDPFVPRQGARIRLGVELGSKIIASSYEYSKYTARVEVALSPIHNHALVLRFFGGLIQGHTPFFNQFFLRDFSRADFRGDALPRVLGLNFSRENDYDDIVVAAGIDYNIPIFAHEHSMLYRLFVFGSLDLAATASLNELQEDPRGRGIVGQWPATFDVGLRLDTDVGQFTASFVYLVDLAI